jgi:hypothetical protein
MFTSDGKVLSCQTRGKVTIAQQASQITHHSSGSMHAAAVIGLKDRSCRWSLFGEYSDVSSPSGPSKFVTFGAGV